MERRFILEKRLIAIFSLAAVVLLPSAFGIEVSVSSDVGGLTEQIGADDNQAVKGKTVIGMDGLSHSISGSGNLREITVASNSAGTYAEVGGYAQSHVVFLWLCTLAGKWISLAGVQIPFCEASETLDVLNAQYIKAYATAHNAKDMDIC